MPDTDPPAPVLEPPRAEGGRRISLVWLVPLLALLISLAVAWRSYSERGPLIEIVFDNAAGIEAGETTLRFRNVTVGLVEELSFTTDLQSVVVSVRLSQAVAPYVDEEAEFWVVRPSVTAQGVTGLDTVLSGVYIEAYWDGIPGERQDTFIGLPRPPLTPSDQPGLRVRLRAPDGGSVVEGAPVLFKSIRVGQVEAIELLDTGDVMIDVFVDAPHHLRLTEATRFWNASGFTIQLGIEGAVLNVDSLASLLQGGIAFDTVGSDLDPVESGYVYELYASEDAARQNAFEDTPGSRMRLDVYFENSVRGLEPGAPVEFRGIRIGEVTAVQAAILEGTDGPRVALRTTLAIVPERLGLPDPGPEADDAALVQAALDLLEAQVEQGLRAQLASASLLTQSLYVDLVVLPDPEPAELERAAEPYPVLPSAPSEVSSITASAEGVLQRMAALPIEELLENAVALLGNVNALLTDEAIRSAPENLGLLLADLRTLVNDSGLMEAPGDVRAVLASIEALLAEASERQVVAAFAEALDAARAAVETVGGAAEGVPELLAEFEALSAEARALPVEELIAAGTRLVEDVDAFVSSETLTTLPASAEASLAELRGLLDALRTGGAVENVNATLASVRQMTDAVAAADLAASLQAAVQETRAAIGNVSAASEELPALIDSLAALADRAAALPLDELAASTRDVLAGADALLKSEGAQAIPASLAAALAETRAILAELRAGGAAENANAALASARQVAAELAAGDLVASLQTAVQEARLAAGNVSAASTELPALLEDLSALAERAAALPLDELVASATDVLDGADAFLGTEGAQSVPASLAAALDETRGILAELRAGGAVENLNSTLASADQAAAAVEAAAADLPALLADLRQASERAGTALGSVAPGSQLNRDALLVLREVRDAARAVNELVTALERRPNSVLFGR